LFRNAFSASALYHFRDRTTARLYLGIARFDPMYRIPERWYSRSEAIEMIEIFSIRTMANRHNACGPSGHAHHARNLRRLQQSGSVRAAGRSLAASSTERGHCGFQPRIAVKPVFHRDRSGKFSIAKHGERTAVAL
jgi:hypothetical protein